MPVGNKAAINDKRWSRSVAHCGERQASLKPALGWIHTTNAGIFSSLSPMHTFVLKFMKAYPKFQRSIWKRYSKNWKKFNFKSISHSWHRILLVVCMCGLSLGGDVESEWQCCSSLLSIEKNPIPFWIWIQLKKYYFMDNNANLQLKEF